MGEPEATYEQHVEPSLEGLDENMTRAEAAERLGVEEAQITDSQFDRMKTFAGSTNAARTEAEKLRQERDTLMQMLQHGQGQPQEQHQQAPPEPGNWFDGNVQLGEDASEEDHLFAAIAKRLEPLINQGHMASGQEMVRTFAPHLKHNLDTQVESEWKEMEGVLKDNFGGLTREEVEPLVVQMQRQQPGRPLRGMVFDVATGILGRVPNNIPRVPSTSKPGAGRRVPAQANVESAPTEATFGSMLADAQSGEKTMGARKALIGAAMAKNMVRQHPRTG